MSVNVDELVQPLCLCVAICGMHFNEINLKMEMDEFERINRKII